MVGPAARAVIAVSDPGSTRLVYAMVIGLVIIGILLVIVGVWLIRQTRVDPPMLAPLERMGERDWLKKDSPTQRRLLDEVRPAGAVPLRPEPDPPAVDEEFEVVAPPASLSDLGPGVGEPRTPTPTDAPFPALDELDDASDDAGEADDAVSEGSDVADGSDVAVSEGSDVADGSDVAVSEGSDVADGSDVAVSEDADVADGSDVAVSDDADAHDDDDVDDPDATDDALLDEQAGATRERPTPENSR